MGDDNTVSGTFLRASDGQFVTKNFKIRDDLVSLHSGTMVVNEYMKRADYDDALTSLSRLDPHARKTFVELASWFNYDRKGYSARVSALPKETLAAFDKAGAKLDYTHLAAVDDKMNRDGRALKDRVADIGRVKLSESLCNFVNLSTHLGGFNAYEAERMRAVFKDAGGRDSNAPEAAYLAKRLISTSSLQLSQALTAARSFAADPQLVR